jgi:hypothetical protein
VYRREISSPVMRAEHSLRVFQNSAEENASDGEKETGGRRKLRN